MKDKLVTRYSAPRIPISRGIYLSILYKDAFVFRYNFVIIKLCQKVRGKGKKIFRDNIERRGAKP